MGRGRGSVQQAIMAALRSYPNVSSKYLAKFIYKAGFQEPTPSQLSGVYKAVRALEAKGAIKRSPIPTMYGEEGWVLAVDPVQLVPRVPLKGKAKAVR